MEHGGGGGGHGGPGLLGRDRVLEVAPVVPLLLIKLEGKFVLQSLKGIKCGTLNRKKLEVGEEAKTTVH